MYYHCFMLRNIFFHKNMMEENSSPLRFLKEERRSAKSDVSKMLFPDIGKITNRIYRLVIFFIRQATARVVSFTRAQLSKISGGLVDRTSGSFLELNGVLQGSKALIQNVLVLTHVPQLPMRFLQLGRMRSYLCNRLQLVVLYSLYRVVVIWLCSLPYIITLLLGYFRKRKQTGGGEDMGFPGNQRSNVEIVVGQVLAVNYKTKWNFQKGDDQARKNKLFLLGIA